MLYLWHFFYNTFSGEVDYTYRFPSKFVGFHGYVRHAGRNAGFTSFKDVAQFSSRHSFVYPVVAFLGRRLLVLTVLTVDGERGFFRQNLIKTDAQLFKDRVPLQRHDLHRRTHIKILPIRRCLQRAVQYEDKEDHVKCYKNECTIYSSNLYTWHDQPNLRFSP